MRHLFVTQDFGPDLGGMARRHVELCRRFGPDDMIVSTVASDGAAAFDRSEPYSVERMAFPFRDAKRFVNQLRWARVIVRHVRSGVNVVHCGNIRPCGYAVRLAAARTGVPYVLYVYGGDVLREREKTAASTSKRLSARSLFGNAAGVVAISRWTTATTKQLFEEIGVRHPPPIADIDLGTDPAQFTPARDLGRLRERYGIGDAPLLLTVARLVPHKGQDVALRSVAALGTEFPALRYLLVGTGADEHRLRNLARELGVEGRVIFAGALSDDEIAEAYATATVYVGLSRLDRGINVEGFGISFIEAGSSGVSSVAGDSGGVRSAVRDGETGVIVPPTDVEAVTAALGALLRDPPRREAMGRAARAAVESHYNWDRVARETLSFVHDAVERRGKDRP